MDGVAVRAVLARAPGLSAAHVRALVCAAESDITRCLGLESIARVELPPRLRSFLVFPDSATVDSDLKWIEASGARLLTIMDEDYPGQLLELPDPPPVLFVLGDPRILSTRQIAMVGARNATDHGSRTAHEFARFFATAGLTVTSGLAVGIDAASHRGALSSSGVTVAVCGTGLDTVYPTQHAVLAEHIRARGALLSQFPPGTPPLRINFPRRNRLISGLSTGTVIVEAALRSGSLITARLAHEQGRGVFAIPGSIRSPLSAGCHELIRAGARLVEHPAEVLSHLKIPFENEQLVKRQNTPAAPAAMDKGYEMLLDAVGFEPATVDVLVVRTGLPCESIASMLLDLELQGRIASYPGGRFGRIPR
jgi:DNA processing protein